MKTGLQGHGGRLDCDVFNDYNGAQISTSSMFQPQNFCGTWDRPVQSMGPGITQSDLLVINKIDLAEMIAADLSIMERNSLKMRGDGPFLFANAKKGYGIEKIATYIENAMDGGGSSYT